MSGFEGAYSTILQGVSQQIPKLRLPGQVTAQDNMLSDVVTNVRRRPGLSLRAAHTPPEMLQETAASIRAWETDIGGQRVHVIVGTISGTVVVLSEDLASIKYKTTAAYLKAGKPQDIRGTTVGDEFFLMNVNQQPLLGPQAEVGPSPRTRGFFYIKAGAFSKNYKVVVTTNLGTKTADFTTPDGRGTGDAAASTPEAIATSLVASVPNPEWNAIGITSVNREGAFVYLHGPALTSLSVASPSGTSYLTVSNLSKVRVESDLPQILAAAGNGYVMAVGDQKVLRYYRYSHLTKEWLECGVYGSPGSLTNMPMSLTWDNAWALKQVPFEGRLAGDDETNPSPNFAGTRKPTGMGSYQNRLVILTGSMVYLSASRNPRRFYRSTVTGLVDDDTISVGSSANSSAEYVYAVPFQKDLLLFSAKYQALLPSSGQALTPRTATVLLTSTYSVDTLSEPVPIGRTLLFSAPRSSDYFGFMEMVSSQYTDAQYVANDATAHLPKYMGGQCRFGVASSVASMVLFAPSRDPRSLVVYEYAWDGDTKVQQAWHTWRFRYPVAAAYFTNEVINLLFMQNGVLVVCTMDPRQGVLNETATRRPFLDFHGELDVVDHKCTLPASLTRFDPQAAASIRLVVASGPLAGEPVGITGTAGAVVTTDRSFPSGRVSYGFGYRSLLSPTPPIALDRNGVKIESAKLSVLRFGVSTMNSSEYMVSVTDSTSADMEALDQATLRFCSSDLVLGQSRTAAQARATIPARTDADSTVLTLYTEGTGELNFAGLDYTGRFNQRLKRR